MKTCFWFAFNSYLKITRRKTKLICIQIQTMMIQDKHDKLAWLPSVNSFQSIVRKAVTSEPVNSSSRSAISFGRIKMQISSALMYVSFTCDMLNRQSLQRLLKCRGIEVLKPLAWESMYVRMHVGYSVCHSDSFGLSLYILQYIRTVCRTKHMGFKFRDNLLSKFKTDQIESASHLYWIILSGSGNFPSQKDYCSNGSSWKWKDIKITHK